MSRIKDVKAKTFISGLFLAIGIPVCLPGCITLADKSKDPYFYSFYEKTRLIMTDDEKKIYNTLPDAASKKAFIEEFWKIRDPDPSTEENENRIEFENRVAFANEWFGNWKTFAGRSMGEGKEKDRGWKTSRGRVYIILGPPSMASYGMGWGPMRLYKDNKNTSEVWYYRRYDLVVYFQKKIPEYWSKEHAGEKDKGEPYLRDWDYELFPTTELLYAMEDAKLNMINNDYRGDFFRVFRAEAAYRNNSFILKIPIERVTFEEREGRLHARYHLKITVYKDHKIIDEVDETKTCSFTEKDVLKKEEIILEVPYTAPGKGNYIFDLTLTDLESMYKTKYRTIIKKKFSRGGGLRPIRSVRF